MTELGHYKKLSLRSLWKHEAKDFTPWLYSNLELLSDAVGFTISKPIKESHTEHFFVDIVGVTGEKDDKIVVIENQFGNSNHDHLGKLITYTAAKKARYAIWIVESAREEHIQAIDMLNQAKNGCKFFLMEATVFQIDDSKPVIRFYKAAEPESLDDEAPVSVLHEWWQKFVAQAKEHKIQAFAHLTPTKLHWMTYGAGKYGVYLEVSVSKKSNTVKFGLSKNGDKDWGNKCYDILYPHRLEIEESFGETLDWERMSENYLSKISKTYDGGYESEEWEPVINKMLERILDLEAAFKPFLDEL